MGKIRDRLPSIVQKCRLRLQRTNRQTNQLQNDSFGAHKDHKTRKSPTLPQILVTQPPSHQGGQSQIPQHRRLEFLTEAEHSMSTHYTEPMISPNDLVAYNTSALPSSPSEKTMTSLNLGCTMTNHKSVSYHCFPESPRHAATEASEPETDATLHFPFLPGNGPGFVSSPHAQYGITTKDLLDKAIDLGQLGTCNIADPQGKKSSSGPESPIHSFSPQPFDDSWEFGQFLDMSYLQG